MIIAALNLMMSCKAPSLFNSCLRTTLLTARGSQLQLTRGTTHARRALRDMQGECDGDGVDPSSALDKKISHKSELYRIALTTADDY